MTLEALLFQALNGLASASSLFFVGAGLSLIFGVTRIINIAHGSFYMLGLYLAYTFATKVGGVLGFWGGIVAAGLVVAALGAVIEILLLRRIYQAPELFQLLATFALVLVINDAGAIPLGPRRPARAARARTARLGRDPRPQLSELRPVPDGDRSGRPAAAPSDAGEDPVRPPDPRRHPGPRDGRRARRQPGDAVHRRVHARRLPGRLRRRAAGRARAGQSVARPDRDRRGVRRRGGRRHGLDHRRLPRRRHHRRGQGAVHRHRRGAFRRLHGQLLQAHAGGGVHRDGDRADRAALRPARPPAGRRAQSGRDRGSDPAGDDAAQARRRRGAGRACCCCRSPTRPRPTRWCSASTC